MVDCKATFDKPLRVLPVVEFGVNPAFSPMYEDVIAAVVVPCTKKVCCGSSTIHARISPVEPVVPFGLMT